MAELAPGAPAAATAGNAGGLTGLRAVHRNTQCLTNGVLVANVTNYRSTFGPVAGTNWRNNLAIHHADIPAAAVLIAAAVHAQAVVLGSDRGMLAGNIPPLMVLVILYYVQIVSRYRLNVWAANVDERLTEVDIDLATGMIYLSAGLAGTAGAIAALQAAGFTDAGNTNAIALNPAGGARPGGLDIQLRLAPAALQQVNEMIRAATLETAATEVMALVGLELASSGHHRLSTNEVVNRLLAKSVVDWPRMATVGGVTVDQLQSIVLHRSLHSFDGNDILNWAAGADSEAQVRAMGNEALSVRLPVDAPLGHAVSARAAVIKAARVIIESTGGRSPSQAIEAALEAVAAQNFTFRRNNSAAIEALLAQTDSLGAFSAAFLKGYGSESRSGDFTEAKALSVKRLKNTHQTEWTRGQAQGESAARAFAEAGVTYAATPIPAGIQPVDGGGAVDVVVNVAVAAAVLTPGAPRAPATVGRLAEMRATHAADMAAFQAQATVAAATGQPLPPQPARLDLSAAF